MSKSGEDARFLARRPGARERKPGRATPWGDLDLDLLGAHLGVGATHDDEDPDEPPLDFEMLPAFGAGTKSTGGRPSIQQRNPRGKGKHAKRWIQEATDIQKF